MRIRIANIRIEDCEQYATQPTLWVRGSRPAIPGPDARSFTLPANGVYDFTTFYGALSVRKWMEYTNARDFVLYAHFEGNADVTLSAADAMSFRSGPTPAMSDPIRVFHGTGGETELIMGIPGLSMGPRGANPPIVGFTVRTFDEDVTFSDAGWYAEVDDSDLRDVTMAICTTTFRKEGYVVPNMEKVERDLLDPAMHREPGDDIAGHVLLNVVDNGRTLDAEALSRGAVRVFPNPNVGGAGGFARGMLEARRQGATHAIMMDDDVAVSTEAFFRTYNILRCVRDEWADAFVSGGMLSILEPDVFSEDTAFMSRDGYCRPVKPTLRMSVLHDIATKETFEPPLYREECRDMTQEYAAWWYCCIPMSQIDDRGLPLPLFVRLDDVEYQLRDGVSPEPRRYITMNGICVWHEPFFARYDPAVERYQTTRNALIARAASGIAPLSDFDSMIESTFELELKRLDYDDAELIVMGMEDFLLGPGVTFAPGFAERRFRETHAAAERTVPLEEAAEQLAALGIDAATLEPADVLRDRRRTVAERAFDVLTLNGHVPLPRRWGKVAVMSLDPGSYQLGETRGADVIVAVDIPRRRVAVRLRDQARFEELTRRFAAARRAIRSREGELTAAYHAAGMHMRKGGGWFAHLGLRASDYE